VRLPRDWVGPREELVPVGPAARARAKAASPTRSQSQDSGPPTVHDFWSEDSGALQDAIQAPEHDSADVCVPADASPPTSGARRRRAWRELRKPEWWPLAARWWAFGFPAAALLVVAVIGTAEPSTVGSSKSATSGHVLARVIAAGAAGSVKRPATEASDRRPISAPSSAERRSVRRVHPTHARVVPRHHPAKGGRTSRGPVTQSSTSVATAPATTPADTAPVAAAPNPPVMASTGTGRAASSRSSEAAGPSGPVSLIGSGTSPSG
jgi:hypothetical protein